jgi:outer membrane receptor for ferrienterochelin and colicin
MTFMKKLAAGAALGVLAAAMAPAVYAQETTGAIQGSVTDAAGAGLANATVTVVHRPTGTRVTTVTDGNGFYVARGLRVGGPYDVTVSSGGDTASRSLPAIGVGDQSRLDLAVVGAGNAVSEVVVTTARATDTGGPGSSFGEQNIQALPSISRDLKDVARTDPLVTIDPSNSDAVSFAGTNSRFNQLTVDGIRQNDDFGLNNNGYPTQRSPVSLDAVEALQVSAAPFSVINNGFIGGSINAVTKSGGNEFHGSLFGDYTSDTYRGDSIRGVKAGGPLKETNYGATLGGPIIKDRLFFFLAYEKYKGEFVLDEGPSDSGRSVVIPRITAGAIDTLAAASRAIYSYDPGDWVDSVPPVEDEKILAKFDWNINDDHRLSLTYQDTSGTAFNGSVIDLFAGGGSTTQPRIGLSTYQYVKQDSLQSYSAQLNSQWSSSLSTEVRLSRKETETIRLVPGLTVGEITVSVPDLAGVSAGAGTPQIRFGTEINSQPNYLNVVTEVGEAIARYQWNEHRFLVGARIERQDILNQFGRQYLGTYGFASYADFLGRRATSFALTGSVPAGSGTVPAAFNTPVAAADVKYSLNTLYAEDNIQIQDNLSLLFGLRYDYYRQDDMPVFNAAFQSRHGFSNQQNVDGMDILLPRVYAEWEPTERLSISGGVGRFSSQGLNVWITNPFPNDGVRQVNAVCPAGPYVNVSLTSPPAGCTFTPGNGNTNVLDPDLKIPNAWKFNFAVEYRFDLGPLGDDWRLGADLLYSRFRDSAIQFDLRSVQVGVAPGGRPIYGRSTTGIIGAGNVFDMMLTNVNDGGYSNAAALALSKEWNEGWLEGLSAQASYTYTRAEDRNPMTSSIADSSYVRFSSYDHQNPALATSDYEIRHKFTLTASWTRKLFGDYATTVSMFAQKRSGLPFSYTYDNSRTGNFDNDFGNVVTQSYSGRQATSNQLLYVPAISGGSVTATSDPRVTYAPGFDVAAFDAFLKSTGLIDYAGSISPRNAFKTKDVTTVDLHFSQELPAFFPGGAKLTAFFDIENFGNLLNDKWGILEQYDFSKQVPVVDTRIVGNQYVYSGLRTAPGTNNQPIKPFNLINSSLWQMKFGVKYSF